MKLINLQVKNLGTIGSSPITFDFTPQYQAMTGENGSGKSTIIHAVHYNLTGEPLYKSAGSKVTVKDLINDKNKSKMLTKGIYLLNDGTEVIIMRGLKPNITSIQIGNDDIIEGSKDVEDKIIELTGLDKKQRKQLIFFSIDYYEPFMSLAPDKRRLFIRKFFEQEIYDDMIDYIKNDNKEDKSELKALDININNANEQKDNLTIEQDEQIKLIQPLIDEDLKLILKEKEDIKELEDKIKEINGKIDRYNRQVLKRKRASYKIETLNKEIIILDNEKDSIKQLEKTITDLNETLLSTLNEKELKFLNDKLKAIKTKQSEYIKKRDIIKDDIDDYEDKISKLKVEIEDSEYNKNEKRIYKLKIKNVEDLINNIPDNKEYDEKKHKQYLSDKNKAKSHIEIYKEDKKVISALESNCPTCRRSLDKDTKARIIKDIDDKLIISNSLYKKYEGLYDDLEAIKSNNNDNDDDRAKYKKQIDKYNQIIEETKVLSKIEIASREDKIQSMVAELVQFKIDANILDANINDTYTDLSSYSMEIKQNNTNIEHNTKVTKKVEETQSKVDVLNEKDFDKLKTDIKNEISDKDYVIEKYSNIENFIIDEENNIIKLEDNKEIADDNIIKLEDNISANKLILSTIEIKINNCDDNIEKYKKQHIKLYDKLSKSIRLEKVVNGIKSYIVSQYTPVLNNLFQKYCEYLETEFRIKLSNDGMEVIIYNRGEIRKYNKFSTGERERIDTIIMMGFIELARLKNGNIFKNIFLDEVTATLDDVNSNKVLNMFGELFKDLNIFLITHKENEKDNPIFDRITRASRNGAFTKYEIIK